MKSAVLCLVVALSAAPLLAAGPSPEEPTWDAHVHEMCVTNGWDFDAVKLGRVEPEDQALRDW